MTHRRSSIALIAFGLFCASCASTAPPPEDLRPGQKPSDESVEAGLWMQMDRAEETLRTSGRVVDDPALTAYVRGIVCRLGPEFCDDIRVFVVRSAGFNATMAPNGTMSVWTGLILRAENEAQLAFVLSHELTHYIKRHSLKQWRDARAMTDSLVFFQLATAMAGVGIVGNVAGIATYGRLMAFSRDHEREADSGGLEIMAKAGYEPKEAPRIWAHLIAEKDASDDDDPWIFFSTHPQSEKRQATLVKMAEETGERGSDTGRERFVAATAKWRSDWLRDELRNRDLKRFHVLLDLLAESGNTGVISFYRGEAHRLEGAEEGRQKAVAAYREALKLGKAPPEVHRSLGLVYWALKRGEEAHAAFRNYLAANPEAHDLQMIEYYLERSP